MLPPWGRGGWVIRRAHVGKRSWRRPGGFLWRHSRVVEMVGNLLYFIYTGTACWLLKRLASVASKARTPTPQGFLFAPITHSLSTILLNLLHPSVQLLGALSTSSSISQQSLVMKLCQLRNWRTDGAYKRIALKIRKRSVRHWNMLVNAVRGTPIFRVSRHQISQLGLGYVGIGRVGRTSYIFWRQTCLAFTILHGWFCSSPSFHIGIYSSHWIFCQHPASITFIRRDWLTILDSSKFIVRLYTFMRGCGIVFAFAIMLENRTLRSQWTFERYGRRRICRQFLCFVLRC